MWGLPEKTSEYFHLVEKRKSGVEFTMICPGRQISGAGQKVSLQGVGPGNPRGLFRS